MLLCYLSTYFMMFAEIAFAFGNTNAYKDLK